ncbi:MAG: hydrogenase maturation nickel metallochaperone HypA [Rouxiella aceris]|uniref:hydrogenase maturation nickel metallochaperone HypA n=1 Tax=Rouxiella aceris TaxID=2703884 RepID=UPI00284F4EC6|nr:hydrogenase maturation nickel metallochaperone HypA [Rouxiella aceris]MDR3431669.1 hydrogenase maturation nickel metallochaperone HypA [Rouxiella aceris]
MHEITLCQNALEIMLQQAAKHPVKKITAVWIELGAFSCVEPEALHFCFDMVCRETLAEGCQLHLIVQDAHSWCHDCQKNIELMNPSVLLCPQCGGRNLRIDADNGMTIKRLEIE